MLLLYRNAFSDPDLIPSKVSGGARVQLFPNGGPNNYPFLRCFCPDTEQGYFGINTEINGVRGSLFPRSGTRRLVFGYWYRIPDTFVPFSGVHKVFYINRTTLVDDQRPLIQFGYGGATPRGFYSLANNTENPFMAERVRFDPFDYLNTWFHSILDLNLDDTSLIGSLRLDGTTVTTPGTYSLYITVPGTQFRNTLVQRDQIQNNAGGWGTVDFLGGYADPRNTHIDIARPVFLG